jgi:hypothetical protein
MIFVLVALTAQLAAAEKALFEEKAARMVVEAARQIVEQSLWTSEEANTALMQDLHSVQASLTFTAEKLTSKSSTLDFAVIQENQMAIKLKVAEEKMKSQGQLLDSTQKALSKQEFSSLAVISSAVANAMASVKNHVPEFDTEILRKDFTVNDIEWEVLVDSVYDTTQHFVSLYDFFVLAEFDENASPGIL